MADESQLIVVAFVCFGVGLLTGVSLAFFFAEVNRFRSPVTEASYLQVETDEKGVIKQVVTR